MTTAEQLRIKQASPDFPLNLSEEEWRVYIVQKLEEHSRVFGTKLKSLYDRIEALDRAFTMLKP